MRCGLDNFLKGVIVFDPILLETFFDSDVRLCKDGFTGR